MSLPSPPPQSSSNESPRRRSRRISLTTRKSIPSFEGPITHMDIFLGSMTAVSELFVYSLVEKARERGATVAMPSIGNFNPDRFLGPNSPYRSPTRLIVFVLSTHAAGKPSPNVENFLVWLSNLLVTDTIPEGAELNEPSAPPGDTSPKSTSQSPLKNRMTTGTAVRADAEPKKTLTASLRSSFRFTWRNLFGGSNAPTTATPKPLLGLHYTVFGVGNSIYRTYNGTAKYVDSRLQELGATRAFPLGLGDVSKSIDITFAKWETHLLQLIPDQPPANSPRRPSTTARQTRLTSHRASLPAIITGAIANGTNMLVGQMATADTTSVDVETQEPKVQQRRYSTSTMLSPHLPLPPLTDK